MGFEPMTFSLEGAKINGLNPDQYKVFLFQKYSKHYAKKIYNKTITHAPNTKRTCSINIIPKSNLPATCTKRILVSLEVEF
jgi:hypothetical protein